MAVLLFHVERELNSIHPSVFGALFVDAAWLGQVGVDIFFVLSGFIMYFVHHGDFARPGMLKRFFLRRLMRIVPTYWLLTTLTVAGLVLLPGLFNSRTPDWTWITASYLFVPWESPAGDISPPVGPGWTLNYEMYFYVIFGSLFLLPRQMALSVIIAFMVGSVVLGLIMKPEVPILALMSSALLIEFLCGILIAWVFTRDAVLNIRICAALLAAAAAVFTIAPMLYTDGDLATWWRLPFFGLPAATLVAVVILRPGLQAPKRTSGPLSRLFVKLGDPSYALYLTHIFTLGIVGLILHRLFPSLPIALDFALIFFLAVLVGHLFFLLVERPIYHFLKTRLLTKKTMELPA